MKPPSPPEAASLLLLATAATTANAALQDDLTNLKASIASATNTLTENQNDTGTAVNTAGMLQSIGWQVGACMANVGCVNSDLTTVNASTAPNAKEIQKAYLDYITSLSPLSIALTKRGNQTHKEPSLPVIQQVQSLTRALYTFGKCLYNSEVISRDAAIDTWNAEGELLQATSEWEGDDDSEGGSGAGTSGRKARMLTRGSCESLKKSA